MTGTYGSLDDLRIVTVTDATAAAMDNGWHSDSEIARLGEAGSSVLEWS
jgi:hypothetical protein